MDKFVEFILNEMYELDRKTLMCERNGYTIKPTTDGYWRGQLYAYKKMLDFLNTPQTTVPETTIEEMVDNMMSKYE